MMQIKWSARSQQDLRDLKTYIGKGSPYYARLFIMKIMQRVEKLADFPTIGRYVPEACGRKDIRELIFQGYRIIYLLESNTIFILTVIHGSRDLQGTLNKPWEI